jgi:hypothetical protein
VATRATGAAEEPNYAAARYPPVAARYSLKRIRQTVPAFLAESGQRRAGSG